MIEKQYLTMNRVSIDNKNRNFKEKVCLPTEREHNQEAHVSE